MLYRVSLALGAFALMISSAWGQDSSEPVVRFRTNLGDIDVVLLTNSAPRTVQNFLNYVNRGAYNNSFFHRSVPGFVIQGGGFRWQNASPNVVAVPEDPPIRNEFRVSNTRGTLAMAKLGSGPDTATSQWFFNLANNASNLDNQNGGFTVFGRVANSASLTVMDRIAAVRVYNAGSPFDQLPLMNYTSGNVQERNLVLVTSISLLDNPAITPGGIITASNFGGFAYASPGSHVEIYGSNLAGSQRGWAASDFSSTGGAPTSIDGVTVSVNTLPAFVSYVSPNQINIQIPADVPTGGQVPIVVSRNGVASGTVLLEMRSLAPALLAPTGFRVGDRQFVAAVRPNGQLASNGEVQGIPASRVIPGEVLVFYGTGFGPVSPSSAAIAGRVASGQSELTSPVEFLFGGIAGRVTYAGLAPGLVGVYQFNVEVPENTPSGDIALQVRQGAIALPQTLFLPVASR
jgi:uncharacterized protein (TIGR03437 family)